MTWQIVLFRFRENQMTAYLTVAQLGGRSLVGGINSWFHWGFGPVVWQITDDDDSSESLIDDSASVVSEVTIIVTIS